MPKITYVQPDGQRQSVSVESGASVMRTAITNGIPGIIAECGGAAMCATCHVYVDEGCLPQLPPINDVENAMLDSAASGRRKNSRLGCQITIPQGIDEIIVNIPPNQT